jgi:hypothetical protein
MCEAPPESRKLNENCVTAPLLGLCIVGRQIGMPKKSICPPFQVSTFVLGAKLRVVSALLALFTRPNTL